MAIDIHSHIWQDQLPKLDGYLDALARAGIEKSVALVLESWGREVNPGEVWRGAGNDYVARCIDEYPDQLILFGTIPPQLDNSADMLEDLVATHPVRGLKLHPAIQGFDPANPQVIRFVRKAAELDLPILIHAGDVGWVGRLAYNDPYRLDDLASNVPEATLIVAHGGASPLVPWIVARHANMYMDTAYAPNWPSLPPFGWKFQCVDEDLIDFLGAHKIFYGTDMNPVISAHRTQVRHLGEEPVGDIETIAREGIKVIDQLRVSDKDKELILEGNARRLLGL